MKKLFLFSLLLAGTALAAPTTRFQNTVTTGNAEMGSVTVTGAAKVGAAGTADAKAVLDLVSTSKGLLPPRMTTVQRDAIAAPPAGLQIYNTTTNKANVYNGTAWADVGSGSGGSSFGVLENGGWESGTAGWSASGGTYAVQTTHFVTGPSGASWDSTAAGQTLCSTAYTVNAGVGLSLQNVEGTINFKCASGTCTHKVQIRDGSTVLSEDTVSSYTDRFQKRGPAIVGFPASGSLSLCVVSVAADEPTLYLDDAYLGAATGILEVSQANHVGTLSVGSAADLVTATTGSNVEYGAISSPGYSVTGEIVRPDTDIAGFKIVNGRAGRYYAFVTAPFMNTTSTTCFWALVDDANSQWLGEHGNTNLTGAPGASFWATKEYAEAGTHTMRIRLNYQASASTCKVSLSTSGLNFTVMRFPTVSELAIRQDDQRLPTVQKFTSGSGTYTLPQKVKWIRVRMVGGGGGGSGSGQSGAGNGGMGVNSTFGPMTANGGERGYAAGAGGSGGTGSCGTLTTCFVSNGGAGQASMLLQGYDGSGGGIGGASVFGGNGATGVRQQAGDAAEANTGGGGQGGGSIAGAQVDVFTGAGGGSGGYVEGIINNPAATYSYSVGTGGAGGTTTSGYVGGAGGSGVVIVEEYYGAMNAPLLIPQTKVVNVSTTYTASSEEIVRADATSAGFTISLPAAALVKDRSITIKKVDSTFNAVTLDPSGSETIDGSATRTLNTIYETFKLFSDGSNWHVVEHKTATGWISYTAAISAASGTVTNSTPAFSWKRDGDDILIKGTITFTGSVGTWTQIRFAIPSGVTGSTYGLEAAIGHWNAMDAGVANYGDGYMFAVSTTAIALRVQRDQGVDRLAGTDTTQALPFAFAANDVIQVNQCRMQIPAWSAP